MLNTIMFFLTFFLLTQNLCAQSLPAIDPTDPSQSQAQPQEATTNQAAEDYQAYKASKFSNSTWDKFVKEGLGAFQAGEIDIAQQNLYKAFNLGCESPIVLFELALINEGQKNYYSALEYYQMAKPGFKKANSNHRFAQTFDENYGRALYLSGKTDQALPLLQKAAKTSKSYWLLKMIGMLAYENGDTLNAVSYFERAVRIETDDVTPKELAYVYTLLARLFLNQSERDGALRYYEKLLEVDPNNSEAKNFITGIRRSYEQKQRQQEQQKKYDDMMDTLQKMDM